MKVLRAKTAGFCFGVSYALKKLDEQVSLFQGSLAKGGEEQGRLVTLGPIIHNPLVMATYAEQGVVCLDDYRQVQAGDKVVIRAHGIPQSIESAVLESGAEVIDATCPKVKKAQLSIAQEVAKGKKLLLLGEKDHPEVQGLLSYAGPDAFVFSSQEELEAYPLKADIAYFLAAQTTQELEGYYLAARFLEENLGRPLTVLETICNATKERQQSVIELSSQVEAMIVVGGLNSGNTRRLADVARLHNVPAQHVETVEGLDLQALQGLSVVGLTAGASTPDKYIDEMEIFLQRLS